MSKEQVFGSLEEWDDRGEHSGFPAVKAEQAKLAHSKSGTRSPLTESEISKTLRLSRRSTEWDYGFEAGVWFAEEFHGVEL